MVRVLALLAGPVVASGGGAAAHGPCYRRRNVNLAKCTHTGANGQFNLYTLQRSGQKDSWAEHAHTNCCCGSDRYGADNILPEPSPRGCRWPAASTPAAPTPTALP